MLEGLMVEVSGMEAAEEVSCLHHPRYRTFPRKKVWESASVEVELDPRKTGIAALVRVVAIAWKELLLSPGIHACVDDLLTNAEIVVRIAGHLHTDLVEQNVGQRVVQAPRTVVGKDAEAILD